MPKSHLNTVVANDHPLFPVFEGLESLNPCVPYFAMSHTFFERQIPGVVEAFFDFIETQAIRYEEVACRVKALSTFRKLFLDLRLGTFDFWDGHGQLSTVACSFVNERVMAPDDAWVHTSAVTTRVGNPHGRPFPLDHGKIYIGFNWRSLEVGEAWQDPLEDKVFASRISDYLASRQIPESELFEVECFFGG